MKRGIIWTIALLLIPGVLADIPTAGDYVIPAGVVISLIVIIALIIWLVVRLVKRGNKKEQEIGSALIEPIVYC